MNNGAGQETLSQNILQENIDPNSVSSLTLAYLGDSVYELIVRTFALKRHNGNANEVNRCAKSFSNAAAQAMIAGLLLDELSEKELQVYKRGRNAKSVSAPKSCSISEYRRATGLEALCAYLYLSGNPQRAFELVQSGIEKYEREQK